jgi:hypothetical protein
MNSARPRRARGVPSSTAFAALLLLLAGCTTPEMSNPPLPADPWAAAEVSTLASMTTATVGSSGGGGGGGGGYRPAPPLPRLSVTDLWETSTPLSTGFGQYTFLLLTPAAGPEAASIRARNLQLLSLLLVRISSGSLPNLGRDARDANRLVIPVTRSIPQRDAEAVLAVYDFGFAADMAARLNLAERQGPLLFSSHLPLQRGQPPPRLHIVQDLSRCPDLVLHFWLTHFLVASNSPNFWEWNDLSGQKLLLQLRTGIESAAPMLGVTLDRMKEFIALAKGE